MAAEWIFLPSRELEWAPLFSPPASVWLALFPMPPAAAVSRRFLRRRRRAWSVTAPTGAHSPSLSSLIGHAFLERFEDHVGLVGLDFRDRLAVADAMPGCLSQR